VAATVETEAPTLIEQADDGSVYLELERLWAETGKPTEAIATCNRAIQANPTNSEAYDHLGLTLCEQGYLSEAIAAYQQAIRINPSLAEAHNHLGLALYQQGNVREAIRAYSRAIQLNPMLKEARQNLDVALRKQGVHLSPDQLNLDPEPIATRPSVVAIPPPVAQPANGIGKNGDIAEMALPMPSNQIPFQQMLDFPRTSYARARAVSLGQSTRSLLWAGAGAISITAIVMGVWFSRNYIDTSLFRLPLFQPPVTNVEQTDDQTDSTETVAALATRQLNRGDILGAESSLQTLLDRGALAQAVAAITPVLSEKTDNPTLNFLMGRAVWQYAMGGNRDYSIEDARRYWETANRREPTPQRQNALGFAAYAAGDLNNARHAWLRALELAGEGSASQTGTKKANPRSSYEALMARAGMALVLVKQAENQPVEERNRNRSQAAQLRQKVLIDDPANFQPDALSKNWMWSAQAVEDWKTVMSLK
jgi:tetratricopeptide (TPR) repeat protein